MYVKARLNRHCVEAVAASKITQFDEKITKSELLQCVELSQEVTDDFVRDTC